MELVCKDRLKSLCCVCPLHAGAVGEVPPRTFLQKPRAPRSELLGQSSEAVGEAEMVNSLICSAFILQSACFCNLFDVEVRHCNEDLTNVSNPKD